MGFNSYCYLHKQWHLVEICTRTLKITQFQQTYATLLWCTENRNKYCLHPFFLLMQSLKLQTASMYFTFINHLKCYKENRKRAIIFLLQKEAIFNGWYNLVLWKEKLAEGYLLVYNLLNQTVDLSISKLSTLKGDFKSKYQ